MGMYHGLKVWFNPDSTSNILSFSSVAKDHMVHVDAAKCDETLVEIEDGKWMKFSQNELRRHVHDAKD